MLPVEFRHDWGQNWEATELGNQTRIDPGNRGAVLSAARTEKKKILDEFIQVTGYHRKHAIRALRKTSGISAAPAPRSRIYDEAVQHALTILWEAADRICGKRLKEAIPTLVDAMERYGHLQLDPEIRRLLLTMSAATMDRVLKPIRETGKQGRRRSGINTALRRSVSVRTFNDWNDPPPGFFEMDMVAGSRLPAATCTA